MLVFSLLQGWSDVYVWLKQSLHTGFLWGALLPWLEAEPWENDSRRRVTADENDNINIWEWERHPGKKVKAVCSREQLKGCPLWDSQADEQKKGEQTADHTAVLTGYQWSHRGIKIGTSLQLENVIFILQLAKLQILDLDKCPIALESVQLWCKDLIQWATVTSSN